MDHSTAEHDHLWMQYALQLAARAQALGEVPVGAVLVREGKILGEGFNSPIATNDPTAHAEIQAIRAASHQLNNYRLGESVLYVTLEPCAMCAGAILQARISRVVFGALDPKAGAVGSIFNVLQHPSLNHRCDVTGGILSHACGQMLVDFFRARRKKEPISLDPLKEYTD